MGIVTIEFFLVYPILQQPLLCNPLAIHQIEKIKTPTEINFNSNPCIGNKDSPPTAPKITANGAVHAGHPGVNAANAPPNIAEEFDLTELILLILNAIIAKFIPANAETPTVNPIDVIIYKGIISIVVSKWVGNIDIVKK